jgi:hypothetical protein
MVGASMSGACPPIGIESEPPPPPQPLTTAKAARTVATVVNE